MKEALVKLIEAGYSYEVNNLCKDIGKALFSGLTEGTDSRNYKYVCQSMKTLNEAYKKEFGEYITPKYGRTKEEMYDYFKENVKKII